MSGCGTTRCASRLVATSSMREYPRMKTVASITRSLRRILTIALLGCSGVACSVEPAATTGSAPPSASLMAPITTLIGDAECGYQSECHVMGIGAKPCGGPSAYVAWSDRTTDANALRTAVQAQAQAQTAAPTTTGP